MAGAGSAEQAGTVVLGIRATLQAELTITTQPEDMDGPMAEPATMDLPAELPADDLILLVDDVKDFVRGLADFAGVHRPRSMMTYRCNLLR